MEAFALSHFCRKKDEGDDAKRVAPVFGDRSDESKVGSLIKDSLLCLSWGKKLTCTQKPL